MTTRFRLWRLGPPALAAALFGAYRLWPDAYHNFDGVMFSAIVSGQEIGWRNQLFSYAGHFLFNATGRAFHVLLAPFVDLRGGFDTVQIMNAGLAGLTVAVTWLFLAGALAPEREDGDRPGAEVALAPEREDGDRPAAGSAGGGLWTAAPLALLTAFSFHFWTRAAECSVYMPALFWVAAAFAALVWYHRSGRRAALAALAACAALAALYHLCHVFWAPALAAFVWLKNRRHAPSDKPGLRPSGAAALFSGLWLAGAALPHVLVYRIFSWEAFRGWYMNQGSASPVTWGLEPGKLHWKLPWGEFGGAAFRVLWAWPPRGAGWLLAAAALSLAAWLAAAAVGRRDRTVRPEDRPLLWFLLLFAAGLFGFQTFWAFELTKYSHLIFGLALGMALVCRGLSGRRLAAARLALWALAAFTAVYNARAAIIPQSRLEGNAELQMALRVRSLTEPEAMVFFSGLEAPLLKVYLPVMAGRKRFTLDLNVLGRSKEELSAYVSGHLRQASRAGVPLYALSELTDARFAARAPAHWGLAKPDVDGMLADFVQEEGPELAPGLRLVRLWPRRVDELRAFCQAALKAGRAAEAAGGLERLVSVQPAPDRESLRALSVIYFKAGDYARAERVVEDTLRAYPDDLPAIYKKGFLLYRRGKAAESEALLRRRAGTSASRYLKEYEEILRKNREKERSRP